MSKPVRHKKHHKNSSRHQPQWRTSQPNIELNEPAFYDIYTQSIQPINNHNNNVHQLSEEEQIRIALEQSGTLYMYEMQQQKKKAELERIKNLRSTIEVVKFKDESKEDEVSEQKSLDTSADTTVSEYDDTDTSAPVAYTQYEYSDHINDLLDKLNTWYEQSQIQSISQLSVLRNAVIDSSVEVIDLMNASAHSDIIQYTDTLLHHERECHDIQEQEIQVMESMYDTDFTLHSILPTCYTIQFKHDDSNTIIDINVSLPTNYPISSRCNVQCYVSPSYTDANIEMQSVIDQYVHNTQLGHDSTVFEVVLYAKEWIDNHIDTHGSTPRNTIPQWLVFDWQQQLVSESDIESRIQQLVKQLQSQYSTLTSSNALPLLRVSLYDSARAIETYTKQTTHNNTSTDTLNTNTNTIDSVYTCLSCWDQYCVREGILMTACNHFMCKLCCAKLIVSNVAIGNAFVKCSGHQCNQYIDTGAIFALLHTDDYIKYRQWIRQNYTSITGYKYCSTPNCNTVFKLLDDSTLNETGYTICHCSSRQCNTCNKSAHYPMSCNSSETYNTSDVIKNMRKQCTILSNLNTDDISVAETKACPKCGLRFEKNSGCNHIHCYQCQHDWCFICEQDWSLHGVSYYDCKFKRATKTRKLIYATNGVAIGENISFIQFYIEREIEHHSYQYRLTELYRDNNKLKQLNKLLPECDIDTLYNSISFLVDCHLILRHVYILCALYREALENSFTTIVTPNGQLLLQHINQLEMYIDTLNSILMPRYSSSVRVQRNSYQMQQTCNSTRKSVLQVIDTLNTFLSVDAARIHELYDDMDQNDAVKRMIDTISDVR